MFLFGYRQEATSKGGNAPTTRKSVGRVKKDDDGREFLSRLVARDVKPRRQGPRDTSCKLETKEAFFAHVAWVRDKRQEHVQDEVKLMFIDVKKAHLERETG